MSGVRWNPAWEVKHPVDSGARVARRRILRLLLTGAALAVAAASPALGAPNVTGLSNPPTWAAGKRVHFFPSPNAAQNGPQRLGGSRRTGHPRGYSCQSGCGQ